MAKRGVVFMAFIRIQELVEDLELEVVYEAKNKDIKIEIAEVNRPGLQLTGFYIYFPYERVQIVGKVERAYSETLGPELRRERADKLLSYNIPCMIVTRGQDINIEYIEAAKKYDRPLLRTNENTTKFMSKLTDYLDDKLAPVITRHGVLVDVYGIGVLIIGESGVGKSETALELIKRGHRLVADDAVEIKRKDNALEGSAPEIIKHFIELRGIGILDIKDLFGVGSIRDKKMIELVIELENWREDKYYDRLGLDDDVIEILGVEVYKNTIPIKPGRNLAMIIEAAARNHKQKRMGYNAAEVLNERLMKSFEK